MPAPLITLTDASSGTIVSLSYNNVDAGSNSGIQTILVWNNFGGSQVVSDAVQASITSKTFNGLDTGDTVTNGQEIVTYTMLNVQCTSQGDSGFTAVGGPTTAPIGNSTVGTIQGSVGGTAAVLNTKIVAVTNVTAGPAQFLLRFNYLYS